MDKKEIQKLYQKKINLLNKDNKYYYDKNKPLIDDKNYDELKISCQPIAINSGYVWPKKGPKNSNKTITISILKPIVAGYSKEEFIKILENNIYAELNLLN